MQRAIPHLVLSAVLCTAILLPLPVLAAHPNGPTLSLGAAPAIAPVDTADSVTAQLATITTDTGAFAPGHRDFSRYDTPGLCRAAARITRASFELSLEAQAIGDTLSEDTIGVGETAPVARACGARFTLANTVARDHGDLFYLALQEQDDALAQAVLAKLVAQDTTEAEKGHSWANALGWYLGFGRVAAAETLMAQVDADSAVAPAALLSMHALLGGYFDRNGDPVRFRREIAQELALAHDHMFQGYSYAEIAYEDLMRLAAIGHPDSMAAVAQQAQRVLREATRKDQVHTILDNFVDWGTLPIDSVIDHLAPSWYTYRRHDGGAVAPRLQADYWFAAPRRPSSDTVRPVRGKVNLICQGGALTDDADEVFNGEPLYSGYQQAAHIRRWLTQYGAAGLEVTIVRSASDWMASNHLQQHFYWLYQTPTEESRVWRWYAQAYEQLPVLVAVQVQHDQWLPQPDGRRWSDSKSQVDEDNIYTRGRTGSCTIIGRDGVILYSSPGGSFRLEDLNQEVEVVLQWLFQGPGASGASTAPTRAVSSRVSLPPLSSSSPQPLRRTAP